VGCVDILVNNAGVVTGKKILDCSDSMMKKTMDINALAHFWVNIMLSSLHFNCRVPGEPGLAGTRMSPLWIILELRMTEVLVTTAAIRCAKLQLTNKPTSTFLQAGCLSCHPTNSVTALKGEYEKRTLFLAWECYIAELDLANGCTTF